MDSKTYIGSLAESRVQTELIRQGFEVFIQTNGKAPFDFVAFKDNKLYRVSVKGTSGGPNEYGSYFIQLRKIRSNKTKNVIKPFNRDECDIVGFYIEDLDFVGFINSNEIQATNGLMFRKEPSNSFFGKSNILDDFKIIKL